MTVAQVKWKDGFDFYTTVLERYDEAWGSYYNGSWYTSIPTIGAWGRLGTAGLKFLRTEEGIKKTGFGNCAEWSVGMAVKISDATRHYLFVLKDGATVQCYAFLDDGGYLYFCTGEPGEETETILAQSAESVITHDRWRHFEFLVTLGSGTGTVEARVDGDPDDPVLQATTLINIQSANAYANTLVIGSEKWVAAYGGQATERYVDDLVVQAGSSLDFIGDARIITRFPTGAGSFTEWTPSTAPNWSCVNTNPPDTSKGVSSSTVDQRDSYAHAALPAGVQSIISVGVTHYSTKLESGSRKIAPIIVLAGTDYGGAEASPSIGSYRHFSHVWNENPANAGNPFSVSEGNSLELGVKITA